MTGWPDLPREIEEKLAEARRLEWWSIFWLATIVGAMYLTLGSSQAMQAAWVEDLLGFIPAVLFLVSTRLERHEPTRAYPYGLHRAGSLTYLVAACTLVALGGYLLYEAASTLLAAEHPTIGSFRLFDRDIWLGWAMIAALAYSAIAPLVLGRRKQRLARPLADKLLHSDGDMMRADWQTAGAGIVGITGIYFGYWWADAAAAGLISGSILLDGVRNARIAVAELLDGAPRELDSTEIGETARRIRHRLEMRYPGSEIRIRQTGRFIRAVVSERNLSGSALARALADGEAWQLVEVSREIETLADSGPADARGAGDPLTPLRPPSARGAGR